MTGRFGRVDIQWTTGKSSPTTVWLVPWFSAEAPFEQPGFPRFYDLGFSFSCRLIWNGTKTECIFWQMGKQHPTLENWSWIGLETQLKLVVPKYAPAGQGQWCPSETCDSWGPSLHFVEDVEVRRVGRNMSDGTEEKDLETLFYFIIIFLPGFINSFPCLKTFLAKVKCCQQ